MRRTRFPWGETGVLGEGMDKCSRGARRGMGPSAYARVAEIMSGRANSQQGLAATCKDLTYEGEPEVSGGFWFDTWVRRSDERRVTPPEMTWRSSRLGVTPRAGKGALGTRRLWMQSTEGTCPNGPTLPAGSDRRLSSADPRLGDGPTTRLRGVCEPALEPPAQWADRSLINDVQSRGQNRTREIRPSGIAGGLWET